MGAQQHLPTHLLLLILISLIIIVIIINPGQSCRKDHVASLQPLACAPIFSIFISFSHPCQCVQKVGGQEEEVGSL